MIETGTITNEQFMADLKRYLTKNEMTQKELAAKVQRAQPTVAGWKQVGLVDDATRRKVVDAYPWLFSSNGSSSDDSSKGEVEEQSSPAAAAKANVARGLQASVKTEFARQYVACLGEILAWFLFSATREEREQFRENLGDAWKDFLELTRGMTGETAFEIAKQEGRLEKWEQR